MKLRSAVSVLIFCGLLSVTYARNFYVAAPKILRLNAEETVAIAMDGAGNDPVDIIVQDYPHRARKIVSQRVPMQSGEPKVVGFRLHPDNFPRNFFSNPGELKFVSLTANFSSFRKELVIPVTSQSGYVFIQTDKPIYTPKQTVLFRIIPVSEEIRESREPFQLVIKNPKNVTIVKKNYDRNHQKLDKVFASHSLKFPSHPVLGEWTAVVRYGHNMKQNSTVHFTVKEYVAPTFTVELTTPDVILPKHKNIDITVKAKYVYGEKLQGSVNFRLGVTRPNSLTAEIFGEVTGRELDDGTYDLRIQTDGIKNLRRIGWFPRVEGFFLFVEATVVDRATGNSETATDVKARFSTTPLVISFDRCLRDFRPGLASVIEAELSYVGGNPASNIKTKIRAVGDDGRSLYMASDSALSDKEGKVTFLIHPESQHKKVTITLETVDDRFDDSQANATFEQNAYNSSSNAYLVISRGSPLRLRPGDLFVKEIHFYPPEMSDIYYMVMAKGKIIKLYKWPIGDYRNQKMEFQITYDMIPSFRVLAFVHYQNELIVDSLKIDVESVCHPDAEVTVFTDRERIGPGNNVKVTMNGKTGTTVGLLGVDEAIYALSRQDLLTKAKLFNTLGSHDLGCGPGGGLNTESVLGNAGITMGTNVYTPKQTVHSCQVEKKRRKRDISVEDIADQYEGIERECCLLVREPNEYNRTCQERAQIIDKKLKERLPSCGKVFVECCAAVEGEFDGDDFGRTTDTVPVPFQIPPDRQTKVSNIRWDFKETWIFADLTIGPEGKSEMGATLPHSITTWVLQAVSLSPENGMCVAEPVKKITCFQEIFLHLNLPYSVVRNEQVEVQVTVFNYGYEETYAYVSMIGTADLCSGLLPDEQSQTKTVHLKKQSASTVTFTVIPLEVKVYPIEVHVLTSKGSDAIMRDLHVVPEGIRRVIDIPIKLDPRNKQGRKKTSIQTEYFTDQIDPNQKIQVTAIKLGTPEGFVPGTARCYITAMGDTFGPAVETSVKNPDKLLRLPGGCGEQNMVGMAPTLYALNYLKASGRLTADVENTASEYIRKGYSNELQFRKEDGSFSTFTKSNSSTWLTAFVMKVFCQAAKHIFIDRSVLCSGVKWLVQHQEADGSYIEKQGLWHKAMVGGVSGKVPFTAFVLIALSECDCDEQNLVLAKHRATAYLEAHVNEAATPLPAAIVSYALALVNSDKKDDAIKKMLGLAKYDEDINRLYWTTPGSAQDIETAGYALMALLLVKDISRCNSIVNWLNTKQLQSGAFKSTQDTVVALQALSKYAIDGSEPVNLVSNITSSIDVKFHKVLRFTEKNALELQDVTMDRAGGTIFITTTGQGQGTLTAQLSYNVIVPIEDICKFEVTVEVTEVKNFLAMEVVGPGDLENFPIAVFDEVRDEMRRPLPGVNEVEAEAEEEILIRRKKREVPVGKEREALNIALCVRYLGEKEAGMSIVDVGTFSGFEPNIPDLKKLQDEENHLIKLYEISSRGVVFYLDKVPNSKNYCFEYHVLREFYIGNTQMSVIKVYDYYNPDESCTKFYRPDKESPMLQTICEGGQQCQCAEGGCPPTKPFAKHKNPNSEISRENLEKAFCDTYNFVWKGELKGFPEKQGNGFFNITFAVTEVVKAGIEKKDAVEGETRTLLIKDNCNNGYYLNKTYIVAGKDGKPYQNAREEIWYRYILDKASAFHLHEDKWPDKQLYRDLDFVVKKFAKTGCNL